MAMAMKATDIQKVLMLKYRQMGYIVVPNCFVYRYEGDVLAKSKSELLIEFEVKISRGDFRREFTHKKAKHIFLSKGVQSANYFYFVCPYHLLEKSDMPKYAGLIWVSAKGDVKYVKKAPRIHKRKATARILKGIVTRLSNIVAYGSWSGESVQP